MKKKDIEFLVDIVPKLFYVLFSKIKVNDDTNLKIQLDEMNIFFIQMFYKYGENFAFEYINSIKIRNQDYQNVVEMKINLMLVILNELNIDFDIETFDRNINSDNTLKVDILVNICNHLVKYASNEEVFRILFNHLKIYFNKHDKMSQSTMNKGIEFIVYTLIDMKMDDLKETHKSKSDSHQFFIFKSIFTLLKFINLENSQNSIHHKIVGFVVPFILHTLSCNISQDVRNESLNLIQTLGVDFELSFKNHMQTHPDQKSLLHKYLTQNTTNNSKNTSKSYKPQNTVKLTMDFSHFD